MLADTERVIQIDSLINQQLKATAELLSVMHSEHQALARQDTKTLTPLIEKKQLLLAELETASVGFLNLLLNDGVSLDKDRIETLLAEMSIATDDHLVAGWNRLQQQLLDCQQQNLVNGQLMEVSRRGTEQALSILLGHGHAEPGLYDGRGATQRTIGGKSYIKV